MSRQFLTHIDLKGNQLYNVVLHNATSNTGLSTTNGSMYYDTTANLFYFRQAGAWVWYMPGSYTLSDISAPTTSVDFNNQRITGVADPSGAQDAANKRYVDAAVNGIDWKSSVRAATSTDLASIFSSPGPVTVTYANNTPGTTASTLTVSASGGNWTGVSFNPGLTLSVGNRVLIKDQSTGLQNGIYTVTQIGNTSNTQNFIFTRAADADTDGEMSGGTAVWVEEGALADTGWVITTDGSITIGTTASVWTQFSGAGQITAGAGLTKSGNTINFVGATLSGLTINADDVAVNASQLWIGTSNVVLSASAPASQALTGISQITGAGANFTLQPATPGGAVAGYTTTINGGTGGTASVGGALNLKGGSGGGGGNGGAVNIDGGTGTVAGAVNIGASSSTINIGQASVSTTNITGTVKIAAQTTNGFVKYTSSDGTLGVDTATYANVASNNAFTGANTFTNATGQTFRQAATQDGIIITGRAGGTNTYSVTLSPTTLTANRAITLPNAAGAVALKTTGAGTGTAATSFSVNHGFGQWVTAQLFLTSTGEQVEVDVTNASTSGGTTTFATPGNTNWTLYTYVIIG